MKKYMAPEMEALSFSIDESIAGPVDSNIFNDVDYGSNW
jgi:hypothetical protein